MNQLVFSFILAFFIKKVKASDGYKKILREYVSYGCDFRHGLPHQKSIRNGYVASFKNLFEIACA